MAVDSANSRGPARFRRLVVQGVRHCAIIAVDEDGIIACWNPGAEALAGYTPREAIGRRYAELFSPGAAGAVTDPLEVARTQGWFQAERWWRTRDGRLVWVDELITRMHEGDVEVGFAVIAHDLTERRLNEDRARQPGGEEPGREANAREHELRAELETAERRAAYLAEASSALAVSSLDVESTTKALARLAVSRLADWCIILEPEGTGRVVRRQVAHRKPAEERALSQLVGTALGPALPGWNPGLAPILSVLRSGQSAIINDVAPSLAHGLVATLTIEARTLPRIERLLLTPLIARGQVLGAIALIASDPDRRFEDRDLMLAEELGRRAAMAMDNARLFDEAQEANRAKADFLAIMSHELRTPLNAIMGYADLLEGEVSGPTTAQQRRQLSRIRASARHLLQLIEEILSFARIDQGEDEIEIERIGAHELARAAAAVIEPMALAKGLAFDVTSRGDDFGLDTDARKAKQVLVNLLSNGVKFTDEGRVELGVGRQGADAIFTIRDTGIGILPEMLDRIFDPFWQAERPNTRRVGGTGLGLSVSRRFARLLGGDITVDSTPGRGTTFIVRLPRRIPDTAEAKASSLAAAGRSM